MLFNKRKNTDELGAILSPLANIRTKLSNFIQGCEKDIDAERATIVNSEETIKERTAEREKADAVLRGDLFKSLE